MLLSLVRRDTCRSTPAIPPSIHPLGTWRSDAATPGPTTIATSTFPRQHSTGEVDRSSCAYDAYVPGPLRGVERRLPCNAQLYSVFGDFTRYGAGTPTESPSNLGVGCSLCQQDYKRLPFCGIDSCVIHRVPQYEIPGQPVALEL